jgi:predicted transcriptional regulator
VAEKARPKRSTRDLDRRYQTSIGPLEATVLKSMAALARPATAREIYARLSKDEQSTCPGVRNCVTRLTAKGLVRRGMYADTYQYSLRASLEELTAQIALDLIEAMAGDRDRIVCRLLGLDPERGDREIARLRAEVEARDPDPRVARLLVRAARTYHG